MNGAGKSTVLQALEDISGTGVKDEE